MRIPMLTKDTFAHKLQCHHEDLLNLFILEQHPPPEVRAAPRHQKSSLEDNSIHVPILTSIIRISRKLRRIIGRKNLKTTLFAIYHSTPHLDTVRFKS